MKKRCVYMPHSFWLGTRDPQLEMGDVKTKKKGCRGRDQEGISKSTP